MKGTLANFTLYAVCTHSISLKRTYALKSGLLIMHSTNKRIPDCSRSKICANIFLFVECLNPVSLAGLLFLSFNHFLPPSLVSVCSADREAEQNMQNKKQNLRKDKMRKKVRRERESLSGLVYSSKQISEVCLYTVPGITDATRR